MINLRGLFGADSCTILTGPVIIWNVHPVMEEILAPLKTATGAFELDA